MDLVFHEPRIGSLERKNLGCLCHAWKLLFISFISLFICCSNVTIQTYWYLPCYAKLTKNCKQWSILHLSLYAFYNPFPKAYSTTQLSLLPCPTRLAHPANVIRVLGKIVPSDKLFSRQYLSIGRKRRNLTICQRTSLVCFGFNSPISS